MGNWYRVIKTIDGRRYVYEQRTWREGKRVRTQSRYVAPVEGATFFRGGGEGAVPRGMTAREIIEYEINELGNDIISVEGLDLSEISSEQLVWLTKTAKAAKQYGKVCKIVLSNYRIVAKDPFGGMLVEKLPRANTTKRKRG